MLAGAGSVHGGDGAASATAPVSVARATEMPACTLFVDARAAAAGVGTPEKPFAAIGAAVEAAAPGAVICVAEGIYEESISPGEKPFTLAGGFKSGAGFQVRDSSLHVSTAKGNGGSFIRIVDPGPKGDALTAIDGFEITGYSQAILRDHWESQRFAITNNHIHGNTCADQTLAGAGFALVNVSGSIRGNVIRNNSCGRGGAGFLNDTLNQNTVAIDGNRIEGNSGTEPDSAHGGGLYLFGNTLAITGNLFLGNSVTQWGAGLYIGAYRPGNQPTTATMSGNVYRGNKAGNSGGGFFCDDGATCIASHELYEKNCGGNILLDGGSDGSGPTVSRFEHITNVGALDASCSGPGIGVLIDNHQTFAPDDHSFTNAIFWGNAPGQDFATACGSGCDQVRITVDRSLVDQSYGDGSLKIAFGPGNIAPADPMFVAPGDGDYQLKPGSPATGMGAHATAGAAVMPAEPAETVAPALAAEEPATPALAATAALVRAVERGGSYMGFPERFNRYYTDPSWTPSRTVHVSPGGGGDGTTADAPMSALDAIAGARPGTLIRFARGEYQGCFELTKENGGTLDSPVVLLAERNADGSPGVRIDCCTSGRQACFNLEDADYVAIEGFELVGGKYGVRAVGRGFPASEHSRGIAVIACTGRDQDRDPFFSGQSDWNVWERNLAHGAGKGDGHGLYISNGSDWNIVRANETHSNHSSDFQINADPASTCQEQGIAFDDPRCDAYAGEGEGGQGASDYFLVDGNYFHHGNGPGANFTSVRRSLIRNNIFGPQARHNVSFWQETENPRLGSSDNLILHNLIVTSGRSGVQFVNGSTRNLFANNILAGTAGSGNALLMEVDGTAGANTYRGNVYIAGRIEGREPGEGEMVLEELAPGWFKSLPGSVEDGADGFLPTPEAPFLGRAEALADAPADRTGAVRSGNVEPGPFEVP
jgi:hypothetical protein